MQGHIRHISCYPAIVRGRSDVEDRARQKIETDAILILDNTMPRQDSADVRGMAKRSASGGCIVDRPLPAGLIDGAAKRNPSNVDDLEPSERELANLVRLFKSS